jgi:hypothetical protein
MRSIVFFFTLGILSMACSQKKTWTPEELATYEADVNAWHAKRIENVKAPNGWLNLAGLYWLEPGVSSFGSDDKNAIVFPKDKIAEQAGYFIVQGNTVSIRTNKEANITSEGQSVVEKVVFHPDSAKPVVLESGSLRWNVIKRDDKLGIRLRDLESETLKTFAGIARYPLNPEYRVEATFEKSPDSTRTIAITNIVGQTSPQASPGTLVFRMQGAEHRLDVLKGSEKEFFIIFADATSGKETYGGGRFLYVGKPVGNEKVIVDFNKAYNPPCVFTPYATCPLPPKQNELSIEIKAGEKNYQHASVGHVTTAL